MPTIIGLASSVPVRREQVGSKAMALIRMSNSGMPVPPGFVLTVEFFEPWLAALRSAPEWEATQRAGSEALRQATRAIQERCRQLEFSHDQQKDLEMALAPFLGPAGASLFAVRSSSPEEDLEGASFAGGYETALGVTAQQMEAAILRSFASAFDERVFLYKREHGFRTDQPQIAVIVQQQIDAESAGVAFSLNPLNNCYDEAVINANFGLGESVVAGEADPDVFVVDKLDRKIIDTQVGNKEIVVRLNPLGGTTRSARAPSQEACITPEQVLELTDLLSRVEVYYQEPVDIEWAISEGRILLLQVRPITTYLPLPEEMITAPGEPKRLYADSTLIEQGVQEPLSVLGTNLLTYVLNQMSTGPVGSVQGVDGIAFATHGRYYMNLSNSLKLMGRNMPLAPGSYGDESVMGILDSIDLEQYLPAKLPGALKASRRQGPLAMIPLLLPAIKALFRPEALLHKYEQRLPAHLSPFGHGVDPKTSLHQQAANLTSLLRFFFMDFGLPMVLAPQIAQRRIKRLLGPDADQVKAQLMSLGTALPGNKTAEMGALMHRLASSNAIGENTSETFLAALEKRALAPEFLQAWDRFLDEFGARCPKEIDVATPRPNEQPALLFQQLKGMALALEGRQGSPSILDRARAKREAAFATLHELALKHSRRKAKALANNYHVLVTLGGYRETPKHYVIKVVDLFRKRVLKVAGSMVTAGRLDKAEQIFDLTIADIDRALADATLDLRALAQDRTVLIKKIERSHLVARVIDSRGRIYYPVRKASGPGELAGVPISPGAVQGRVKVLHRADEKPVLPGEILVTRATDPGWTPLFINAGGIILEVGGVLQHGAVVAREYGIPCVSGVTNASELLRDGQMVEVDGTNGIVRILGESVEPEQA